MSNVGKWGTAIVVLAAGATGYLAWRNFAPTPKPEPAPSYLMRALDMGDMAVIESGGKLPILDWFIYGHHGMYEDAVRMLKEGGKGCVRYFNVGDIARETAAGAWTGPWFGFVGAVVFREWGAVYVNSAGDTAYSWVGADRYLINWAKIDSARAERLVMAQVEAAGSGCSAFWDLYFPRPAAWMFDQDGAQYGDFSPVFFALHEKNLLAARRIADRRFIRSVAGGPQPPFGVMVNGARDAPAPAYLENAQEWWSAAREKWVKDHPRDCLSCDGEAKATVDSIIGAWIARGGVAAFTNAGNEAAEEAAYQKAAAARGPS